MKLTKPIIFILCVAYSLSAWSNVYTERDYQKQRKRYIEAESYLKNNQLEKFQALKPSLQKYPLYPYLEYKEIKSQLSELPTEKIQRFIRTYDEQPLAEQLRKVWFAELIKQERYQEVTHLFSKPSDTAEKCQYLLAQLKTGQLQAIEPELKTLWLVGKSQPNACDPLFDAWFEQHPANDELIAERAFLALKANQKRLAKYLIKQMQDSNIADANLMLKLFNQPSALMNDTSTHGHIRQNPRLFIPAFYRLAKLNPANADSTLAIWLPQLNLSADEKHQLKRRLLKQLRFEDPERAMQLMAQWPRAVLDDDLRAWWVRTTLKQGNWPNVSTLIEAMPETQQKLPEWQYWYARSLEKQQAHSSAKIRYRQLAQYRNYYGFLAAERLGQSYSMHDNALQITTEEYRTVANNPGLKRARELYHLKRYHDGNLEWWRTIEHFDEKQRYIAAKIAKANNWPNLALATATKAAHKDDLKLRFPTTFKKHAQLAAHSNQLPLPMVFAIIRQESLFQHGATSRSGARGLMQLMPQTARAVAKKIKQQLPSLYSLYQPHINIRLGTSYLRYLLSRYGNHPLLAIASYNAGPNRVAHWLPQETPEQADIWIETIPWRETRNYVKYVVTYTAVYQYILGKTPNLKGYLLSVPTKS